MPRFLVWCLLVCPFFCLGQKSPKLVSRNYKAPVEISGVLIKQDKHNVGYYRLLSPYNNGQPTRVYQLFLPNGTQIATAFTYGKDSHDWLITILQNPDITFNVNSKEGADVKDIAMTLIKNGYL